MKKYLKISLLLMLVVALFNACETDDYNFEFSEDINLTRFYELETKYAVTADQTPKDIQLKVSGKVMSKDITLTIEVGGTTDTVYVGKDKYTTTAVSGTHYSLSTTSVTIPAGESFGTIPVTGLFAGLDADGPQDLVLKITSSSIESASYNQLMVIHMEKSCPFVSSEFVGTWELTDYSYFDDAFMAPYDVEITNDAADPSILYLTGIGLGWDPGPWNTYTFTCHMDASDPNAPVWYMDDVDEADWDMMDIAKAFGFTGGTFDVCAKEMVFSWYRICCGANAATDGSYLVKK